MIRTHVSFLILAVVTCIVPLSFSTDGFSVSAAGAAVGPSHVRITGSRFAGAWSNRRPASLDTATAKKFTQPCASTMNILETTCSSTHRAAFQGLSQSRTSTAVDQGPARFWTSTAVDQGPARFWTSTAVDQGPARFRTITAADQGPARFPTNTAADKGPASSPANGAAIRGHAPSPIRGAATQGATAFAGDSAAIHAQSRAFSRAYERGDVDAMMAIYTADAVIFPGNMEMIQGREDLRAYWALGPAQRVTHHEATPTAIRVEGDMASDYGVYEVSGIRGGETWGPFRGKYMIVWRREADGAWRMELDMWNARSRDAQPTIDCAEMASAGKIHASCVSAVDLGGHFEGMEATFVLYDSEAGTARVHNRERARERFIPASTFKIPNSVIALETETASGPDFNLAWDSAAAPPQPFWPASWKRDQTLQSALRNSVVWYYQELARRMGEETIQRWLDRFDYGNRDIRGSVDRFWLRGPLTISPFEQVAFLDRLSKNKLGISDRTTQIVKKMLVLEEGDGFVLRGKTGTAEVTATRELGWLVGFVEVDDARHVYALNMEGERVWEEWPPHKRSELVKKLLREMGVIPAE